MVLDLIEVGSRFRRVREELLKVSQADLAVTVGTNQVSISNLENGKGVVPSLIMVLINYIYSKGFNAALIFQGVRDFDTQDLKINYTKYGVIKTLEDSKSSISKTLLGTIDKLKSQ